MEDSTLKKFLIISALGAGAAIVIAMYNRQRLKEKFFPKPEVIRVAVQRGLPQRKKK
jgi:hypothetical protein